MDPEVQRYLSGLTAQQLAEWQARQGLTDAQMPQITDPGTGALLTAPAGPAMPEGIAALGAIGGAPPAWPGLQQPPLGPQPPAPDDFTRPLEFLPPESAPSPVPASPPVPYFEPPGIPDIRPKPRPDAFRMQPRPTPVVTPAAKPPAPVGTSPTGAPKVMSSSNRPRKRPPGAASVRAKLGKMFGRARTGLKTYFTSGASRRTQANIAKARMLQASRKG